MAEPFRPSSRSRSTLARPTTFILHIEDLIVVVLERSCARRPLALITSPIPANRSPPDRSPRVFSHDPAVQCNPEGGREQRLARGGRFFLYAFADCLGKLVQFPRNLSHHPFFADRKNLDHAEWRALHLQPFLPFAPDAD